MQPVDSRSIGRRLFVSIVWFLSLCGLVLIASLVAFLLYPPPGGPLPPAPARLPVPPQRTFSTAEEMYLDLLKKTLTRYQVATPRQRFTMNPQKPVVRTVYKGIKALLELKALELVRVLPLDEKSYQEGSLVSEDAETQLGLKRLDNLEFCIHDVLRRRVPGDLMEAGAWRGGATIFMRAVLKVYKDTERTVWVADSFQGMPKPDPSVEREPPFGEGFLAVSLDDARYNFARYGMLDNKVRFLKGFFRDTLPQAPIDRLAVLRIDADYYQSTWEALQYLYPKLSVGGFVILDDYGELPDAKRAVHDYRKAHGIAEEIKLTDYSEVYWQKQR